MEVVAAALALAVTLALTPVMAAVARRTGIVDAPGALKVHERPVPYLGGAAVFLGLVCSIEWALLVPAGLALVLGTADDKWSIPPWLRFAVEIPVGVAVAAVADGGLPGVVVVLGTVALINAVNMLDGSDGVAGGVGLASAAGFVAVATGDARLLAAALAGALAGFLFWNRPPARIYLGDGGAYLLGAVLATLAADVPGDRRVGAALLLGVPALELATTVLRRARTRTSLTEGDRGHTYDRLRDRGWSVLRVALTMAAAQAVLAGVALSTLR